MTTKDRPVPPGKREIFVPYIRDRKTGKRRYPRNAKFFHFFVDV